MLQTQKTNMSGNSKKWRASERSESKKLASAEKGWTLAGGDSTSSIARTRGSSKKAAAAAAPVEEDNPPVADVAALPDDDVSTLTNTAAGSTTSTTTSRSRSYSPHHLRKPAPSRVILNVNSLKTMLEMHLAPCPHCRSRLVVTFPTTCIASGCQLRCPQYGKDCQFTATAAPEVTEFVTAGTLNICRNTDYAVNILYVLGFIASGDGGTEAARLLGLLGLPNSTTMQSRSFGNIEDSIGPTVVKLGDRIIYDNLCEEVKAVYGDRVNANNENLYQLWVIGSDKLTKEEWPRVKAGTDMGWNQKGSGRKYNSKSGHCFFCGSLKRQAICKATCSKACAKCKSWYTTHTIDEKVPAHDSCTINYAGSSQSMEPNAVLELYTKMYKERVIVSVIICDDDSSIKAKLKWSNANYIINSKGNLTTRPDQGALPRHMPEPTYVADPNHRRKTLSGVLYKLKEKPKTPPEEAQAKYEKAWHKKRNKEHDKAVAKAKAENKPLPPPLDPKQKPPLRSFKNWNLTMTGTDVTRLTKNFAFMAKSLHRLTNDHDILMCGKCVIEHHFDNHEHCDEWCRRKEQSEEERKKHFYRCKTKDAELYAELNRLLRRFITLEALKEVAHNMDTLVNESLNNTIAWIAPKNKVYCGTVSLSVRIAIAVGITSLGPLHFFTDLFRVLGIRMTADVAHWLEVRDSSRSRRLAKTKTTEYKRRRLRHKYEKLAEDTKIAKAERAKREGTYQPGIGLDGGYAEADTESETLPQQQKKKAALDLTKVCLHCGVHGHQRKTNKLCKYYTPAKKRARPGAAVADTSAVVVAKATFKDDAEEADAMDSMPLVENNSDTGSSGDDAYFDVGEYSSDDADSCDNANAGSCII